ncbi:glyoxalase [Pseudofulvibacter geojedonensis]|uniref:Glyoxalase n=1 Tax=Pseudofulvibacter geojedonensis TaxID=1123758 RepID=A0ABW3HYS4_9FLAO
MDNRTDDLLKIRLGIETASLSDNMRDEERFQNTSIRPAIKFQSDLLIEAFKNYAKKHKCVFYSLSIDKKMVYIENAIQRDMKFRNSLKGMIIGAFTVPEYKQYIQNSSALNKRMMQIVIERLKDNVLLLDNENPPLHKAG